jgi:hypothetical protein
MNADFFALAFTAALNPEAARPRRGRRLAGERKLVA